MEDTLTLRTTIHAPLLKHTLFRGTTLAAIGMLSMVIAGTALPPSSLTQWGFIIFFIGILLITYGLLPYRRLTKLQTNPNKIVLSSDNTLRYYTNDKPLLTLPMTSIQKLHYSREGVHYGIGVMLKSPLPNPVILHSKTLSPKTPYDLYFPYFGKRAFEELHQHLNTG